MNLIKHACRITAFVATTPDSEKVWDAELKLSTAPGDEAKQPAHSGTGSLPGIHGRRDSNRAGRVDVAGRAVFFAALLMTQLLKWNALVALVAASCLGLLLRRLLC